MSHGPRPSVFSDPFLPIPLFLPSAPLSHPSFPRNPSDEPPRARPCVHRDVGWTRSKTLHPPTSVPFAPGAVDSGSKGGWIDDDEATGHRRLVVSWRRWRRAFGSRRMRTWTWRKWRRRRKPWDMEGRKDARRWWPPTWEGTVRGRNRNVRAPEPTRSSG